MVQSKHQCLPLSLVLIALLIASASSTKGNKVVHTHITCLYDLPNRPTNQYLNSFSRLMNSLSTMIIFGPAQHEELIWKYRKANNTVYIVREVESFKSLWYYSSIQKLKGEKSTQEVISLARLLLMNEGLKHDKFATDFAVWVSPNIFETDKIVNQHFTQQFFQYIQPQWVFFIQKRKEITHQWKREGYPKENMLVNPHFFGGYVEAVRDMSCAYENLLRIILNENRMVSSEFTLSMMIKRFPYLIPATTNLTFHQLKNYALIYENVNHKPKWLKHMRLDFNQQSVLVGYTNNMTTTRFNFQPTQPLEPYRMPSFHADDSPLYKQIFYREFALFVASLTFYSVLKWKISKL